jgi:hypothetical protein
MQPDVTQRPDAGSRLTKPERRALSGLAPPASTVLRIPLGGTRLRRAVDPGDLCQPSGPDGKGQAKGQARNARGEPSQSPVYELTRRVMPRAKAARMPVFERSITGNPNFSGGRIRDARQACPLRAVRGVRTGARRPLTDNRR